MDKAPQSATKKIAVSVRNKNSKIGKNNLKRCDDATQKPVFEKLPRINFNQNETDQHRHKGLRTMQRALAAYAYGRLDIITAACRRVRAHRATWSRCVATYQWFDRAVSSKHEEIGDMLEATAIRQAVEGDTRMMLRCWDASREKYSEKTERHTYHHDPVETLDKAHERARIAIRMERRWH